MIGILGAMECEVEGLIAKLLEPQRISDGNFTWYRGELSGRQVVIGKCGVGKVLAAASTQRLIDTFSPTALICTGVAGALDPELEIGDVVVSLDCVQHDMDATPLGVPRGQIPYTEYFTLAADPGLIAAIADFSSPEYRVRQGRILSGDQFVTHIMRQTHGEFFASLNGMAVEMEGAAIALVCRLNLVPFLVVRTVSDRADDSAVMDFDSLAALVAPRSCAVVEHLLAAL